MRAAFLLCLLLLSSQARAVFDVFLEVTPVSGPVIAGGTADALYAGWIETVSFEAASEIPVTIGSGNTGITIGRSNFKEFPMAGRHSTA